jgi:ChrB-like protein
MEHRRDQEQSGDGPGLWVLLCYRVPREPSAPRIAIWRTLKRLGAGQLGDGLVGLPADARTREQLEWVAEDVTEAGGSAGVWLARPATLAQERELAAAMAAARAAEYAAVAAEAGTAQAAGAAARAAALRRLRAELRRITRRDYFPPAAREQAHAAVEALARPPGASLDAVRAGRDAAAAGDAGEHP